MIRAPIDYNANLRTQSTSRACFGMRIGLSQSKAAHWFWYERSMPFSPVSAWDVYDHHTATRRECVLRARHHRLV